MRVLYAGVIYIRPSMRYLQVLLSCVIWYSTIIIIIGTIIIKHQTFFLKISLKNIPAFFLFSLFLTPSSQSYLREYFAAQNVQSYDLEGELLSKDINLDIAPPLVGVLERVAVALDGGAGDVVFHLRVFEHQVRQLYAQQVGPTAV